MPLKILPVSFVKRLKMTFSEGNYDYFQGFIDLGPKIKPNFLPLKSKNLISGFEMTGKIVQLYQAISAWSD